MTGSAFDRVTVPPMDEYNQQMVNYLHPNDWVNPKSTGVYDLVVIGAGTAGLVVAAGSAGLDIGLKIAIIEKHLMGGDCLTVGCVPSKCVIRSSRVVGEMMNAATFGIGVPEQIKIDFPAVMQRMRKLRASISHHDSAQRFSSLGIDVFLGSGTFTGENTIAVGDRTLQFKKAVIATGARAVRPRVEGIDEVGFLTNETVFNLTQKPNRLAVIGGGPIGCELAQSFRRLGCEVVLLHRGSHILNKEDADAADIVQNVFDREGLQVELGVKLTRASRSETGKVLHYEQDGQQKTIEVDEILVGAGRAANVEGLNLEQMGVSYDKYGVHVDDHLQTTNPKIFAAGDICKDYWKFTHAAESAAVIVIKNALLSPFGLTKYKVSDLIMPWVTYTDPEIAHVGMYENEAQEKGISVSTIKIPMDTVDRAIADSETEGFVKVHHETGSDKILGATIVAPHAGEMIGEVTTAMYNKIGLKKIASVIHPYPVQADGIKKAAAAYRKTLVTPTAKRLLKFSQ
jgi:pyruvate/2-oxoglutarate dehydrogenase complex dihydrolipoamide dehydrogenase (E3) component